MLTLISERARCCLCSVSASGSLKDVEVDGNSINAELEWELIVLSERFQQCLLAVERSVLRNNFQPQLAAYRQLPVLEGDPAHHHTCTAHI